ncbi:MAG: hypothetical protein ABW106_07460 [Steroidobacteraceae bacterium]
MKSNAARILIANALSTFIAFSALAGPTPITAGLRLDTLADAHVIFGEEEPNFIDIDFENAFQVETLNPMTVAAMAASVDGDASVVTSGWAHASWKNPSAGRVEFRGLGWTTKKVTANGRAAINSNATLPYWIYTVVPDVDTVFTISWDVKANGTDTSGLNGFEFSLDQAPQQSMELNTSGTASVVLSAGTSYLLGITTKSDTDPTFLGTPLGTRSAHMNGIFKWKMKPL